MTIEKWIESLASSLFAWLFVITLFYFMSNVPSADGLGGVIFFFWLFQALFILNAIVSGKEAMKQGDERGKYGLAIAICSFFPYIISVIF